METSTVNLSCEKIKKSLSRSAHQRNAIKRYDGGPTLHVGREFCNFFFRA